MRYKWRYLTEIVPLVKSMAPMHCINFMLNLFAMDRQVCNSLHPFSTHTIIVVFDLRADLEGPSYHLYLCTRSSSKLQAPEISQTPYAKESSK